MQQVVGTFIGAVVDALAQRGGAACQFVYGKVFHDSDLFACISEFLSHADLTNLTEASRFALACRLCRVFTSRRHTRVKQCVLCEIRVICVRHIHRTWLSRFLRDLRA